METVEINKKWLEELAALAISVQETLDAENLYDSQEVAQLIGFAKSAKGLI